MGISWFIEILADLPPLDKTKQNNLSVKFFNNLVSKCKKITRVKKRRGKPRQIISRGWSFDGVEALSLFSFYFFSSTLSVSLFRALLSLLLLSFLLFLPPSPLGLPPSLPPRRLLIADTPPAFLLESSTIGIYLAKTTAISPAASAAKLSWNAGWNSRATENGFPTLSSGRNSVPKSRCSSGSLDIRRIWNRLIKTGSEWPFQPASGCGTCGRRTKAGIIAWSPTWTEFRKTCLRPTGRGSICPFIRRLNSLKRRNRSSFWRKECL